MPALGRKCRICGTPLETRIPSNQNSCNPCRALSKRVNNSKTVYRFLTSRIPGIKERAKSRNLKFDLDIDSIFEIYQEQKGNCALSGLPMKHEVGETNMSLSVDRVDSTKGYTKDNIQLVCGRTNAMKSDMKDMDFIWWCKAISNHNAD